jgi:hypothetical protein
MNEQSEQLAVRIVYGSSDCPFCAKRHFAFLQTGERCLPPPVITVFCGCVTPPVPVPLNYSGNEQ